MLIKATWISVLLVCSLGFLVDQSNYFYINTSYAKQTISLTMCFSLNQSSEIKLISPLLIPQGNHVMNGFIERGKSINLDNLYESQTILYNSYQEGEHWFGVKLRYSNPKKYEFVSLSMQLKQDGKISVFTFLAPLFTIPLNAIQVSPINTLYTCKELVLISYLESYSEVDFYAFGRTNQTSAFKVTQKKDWGFYREDFTANYLRHKTKSGRKSQLTLSYVQNKDGKNFQCKVSEEILGNQSAFSGEAEGFTLAELLEKSKKVSSETEAIKSQL